MPSASIPSARRATWAVARCALALALGNGAAVAAPDAQPVAKPRITAREMVERQFAAQPTRPGETSAAEAVRMRQLYLQRMGQKLVPQREIAEGGTGR